MERIFSKDVGRFSKGEIKDYPQPTWGQIAVSAKKPLHTFSTARDDVSSFKRTKGAKHE